jgi:toxin ParE1/3/4
VGRKVVFRAAAERDLAKLYKDIKESRGERGMKRDDIRPGLRIIGFERRVAIAFTFDEEHVRIGRILYGGRDYEALLGARE